MTLNMKKLFLVLVLCLSTLASWAQNDYDFSAVAPTGQTLYYKILEDHFFISFPSNVTFPAVGVVAPNTYYWGDFDAPTGDLTIPCTVTYNNTTYYVVKILENAFGDCSGLTSATIPFSVSRIESFAFKNCSSLLYIVLGSSFEDPDGVQSININSDAFTDCTHLTTAYSFCPISGYLEVERLITASSITISGTGANRIYQLDECYYILVDDAHGGGLPELELTTPTLPTNFIAKRNGSWFAREILLTDGKDEFKAPVEFTAAKATYTRSYTQSHRSTLCLPFKPSSVSSTGNMKFYEFRDFDGSSIIFSEVAFDDFEDNTPYMVEWPDTKAQTDFLFSANNVTIPATNSVSRHVEHNNGRFFGTTARTCMDISCYGYKDGFFVRSADNIDVPWWEDPCSGHAHVNPFRAYFKISPGNASQPLPSTLNVEVGYGDPVGIDAAEAPEQEYDGRYGNDVYDMLGRLVRKNADNLEGLPRGIYIWKGKKVVRGER